MAEATEWPRRSDWRIVFAFGLVGLVGGWLTAELWHIGDALGNALLPGTTTLVAAGLGWMAPRVWSVSPIALGFAVLLAGALNGALNLLVLLFGLLATKGGDGGEMILVLPLLAALFGAVVALPFVPGLLAIARCHRRLSRARVGSVVREAYDRAFWRSCAMVVAGGCATTLLDSRTPRLATAMVSVLAGATVVLTTLIDLRGLSQVRRLARQMGRSRAWVMSAAELGLARRAGLVTDLGRGDQVVATLDAVIHVYRDVERPRAIYRGDLEHCRKTLVRLAIGSIGMSGAACALAWLHWTAH